MMLPHIRNHRTAVVVGLGLFLLSLWILYDAYEGRGKSTPRVLRPFLPI